MFTVIKKRHLIAASLILIFIIAISAVTINAALAYKRLPKLDYTVVIDAGHGGIDSGVVGVTTKVKEAELNLKVAKKLEKTLKDYGFNVVMTRTNANGLYGLHTKNRKRRDMEERARIIHEAKPDAVISIHMNYFSQSKQRGAQVFYKKDNEQGKELAKCIQEVLALNIEHCNRIYLPGDYYILNCSDYPAVIVECGFLSNAYDEQLLITDEYQQKLAYYITLGIMKFLNIDPYQIIKFDIL
ncbi:MAG TPA: N-acetylmuramoyl-L-alanine amidase [Clostridia bacterium]